MKKHFNNALLITLCGTVGAMNLCSAVAMFSTVYNRMYGNK